MENDFRKLWLAAMLIVAGIMLICLVNVSHGAKAKGSDLIGTVTNLDAIISGAGTPDTVCVLIWKGRNGTEHKVNQFRNVHLFTDTIYHKGASVLRWRDVCLDTAYGEWGLYQASVQVWNKAKVETFNSDGANRYVIESADLTKTQSDKIKDTGKAVQSLGNFRIKKEAK